MLIACGSSFTTVDRGDGASLIFGGIGSMNVTTGLGSFQIVLGSGSGSGCVVEGTGATVYNVVGGAAGGATAISGFRPSIDQIDVFGCQPSGVTASNTSGSTLIHFNDGKQINLPGVAGLSHSLIFD